MFVDYEVNKISTLTISLSKTFNSFNTDVIGCNEVDVFYWSEEHCEMTLLPDNIFYVTQNQ